MRIPILILSTTGGERAEIFHTDLRAGLEKRVSGF